MASELQFCPYLKCTLIYNCIYGKSFDWVSAKVYKNATVRFLTMSLF